MEGETVRLASELDDQTLSDIERARQGLRDDLIVTLFTAFIIGKDDPDGCDECGLGIRMPGSLATMRQYQEVLQAYGAFMVAMRTLNDAESTEREQPEDAIMRIWRGGER